MKAVGIVGFSGIGKTTLIEKLIVEFGRAGKRVSVIKHTHHDFDLDTPGKDSWRHRQAGAQEVLLASSRRWVLMRELEDGEQPTLEDQMALLAPCDLVLIEGFRNMPVPQIRIWRNDHVEARAQGLRLEEGGQVVAIATDAPGSISPGCQLPVLNLNDAPAIAYFILRTLL